MDQQFAIAGYTGSSCLMCAIDGADIWQVDYFGNRQQLIGKTAVAIVNLPPRKMMGIPSCGMLLSAVHKEKGEEKLHLMLIDDSVPAGAKLC